jgi:hypothetical protein
MAEYPECGTLLTSFMDIFLPSLWMQSNVSRQRELEAIRGWCADEENVAALDRFAAWGATMRGAHRAAMQDLYDKLEFHRDREARVESARGSDWTFTVHVIRFVFCHRLSPAAKKSLMARALSTQLLDYIEEETAQANGRRTPPPHQERRGRGTPGPQRIRVDRLLLRLCDFIE